MWRIALPWKDYSSRSQLTNRVALSACLPAHSQIQPSLYNRKPSKQITSRKCPHRKPPSKILSASRNNDPDPVDTCVLPSSYSAK
ncbi:hypothetical protein CHARACLAT_026985 [Characodon lateralis]|uniref:Uncharacterized protein n=1 Tax=Characodon lateralis TaxID=208331 RepID=A0ABU7F6E7_9TELE|nr:hypothetical protein [Characodon lateralis]